MMRQQNNYLRPSDFSADAFPTKPFSFSVDSLCAYGSKHPDHQIEAIYDKHADLRLTSNIGFLASPREINQQTETTLSDASIKDPVTLIGTSRYAEETEYVPQRTPFVMDFGGAADFATAVLINGPEAISLGSLVEFCAKDHQITVSPVAGIHDVLRDRRQHRYDFIATSILKVTRLDSGPVDSAFAFKTFTKFGQFLAFARGGLCGVGNIRGESTQNGLRYIWLGFSGADLFHVPIGWCDYTQPSVMQDVYSRYLEVTESDSVGSMLWLATQYYRASNVARDTSVEVAIVSGYAALETLVHHILDTQGGWSTELLGRRVSFHNKLRAAAHFVGLGRDVLEHAPNLRSAVSRSTGTDAFSAITQFRNYVTHPGNRQAKYSGIELDEAWRCTMWLCEVLIFHILGYRGPMNDRRRKHGWRGEVVSVPLNR